MTPAQIKAQFDQAQQQIRDGQAQQAIPLLRALLPATQNAPEVLFQLSRALDRMGDTPAAAEALRAALDKRPTDPTLINAALPIFTRLGDSDMVLRLCDARIALTKGDIAAQAEKALYLQQIGDFPAAGALLKALIKAAPDNASLYRLYAFNQKIKKDDPTLTRMKKLWKAKGLNDAGRMDLGYALAKAHDDIGKPKQVFAYLDAANAAQLRQAPYDPEAQDRAWAKYRPALERLDPTPKGAPLPVRPVFISGMPRSGTTLVDQILGAHSQVTSGGELSHAIRQARVLFEKDGALPDFSTLPQADFDRFAESYNLLVRRDTGVTSGVVTDKSMQLQLMYPLLLRALPGARIIVVQRDPRSIALSIYRNAFVVGAHRYANAWDSIAAEIKAFRARVAFWQERMPEQIHTVRYEDLVSDPDTQTRALVTAAGLEWEDACLSFHERVGRVKTLSLGQVRQPINANRREAWRTYEAELAPFIDAWGDTPWD